MAGVPYVYACDSPVVPSLPAESTSGVERFAILHYEGHEPAPGSAKQSSYIMQLRKELSMNLDVGINRVFVLNFGRGFETHEDHHDHDDEDTDIIIELFLADAPPNEVNKASAAELLTKLTEMLADENSDIHKGSVTGSIEGSLTEEPPHAEEHDDGTSALSNGSSSNDDDDWPVGAIVGLVIGIFVAILAMIAAFVFRKREEKAIYDLEQAKLGGEKTDFDLDKSKEAMNDEMP